MESLITVSTNQPPCFRSNHHRKANIPLFACRSSWQLYAAEGTTSGRGFSPSSAPNSLNKNLKKRAPAEPATISMKTTGGSNNQQITSQGRKDPGTEDSVMPKVVVERLIRRMSGYVGIPLVVGLATLQLIGAVKEKGIWDVPMWVPFIAIFISFGGSTLGIVYGALSTSLDPDKEGSFLGLEEARSNWDEMWMEDRDDNKS